MHPLSVSIQAGGQSRRMGRNKALLSFVGQPLIQRVAERVQPVAAELLVVANQVEMYAFLGLRVEPDQVAEQGPMGGLFTALCVSTHPFVAVVGCDMPFVNPLLLEAELEMARSSGVDVVIPAASNGLEPLHAVYHRETCLGYVQQALAAGERRLTGWLERASVRVLTRAEIAPYDPQETAFININTPEDLVRAEELARLPGGKRLVSE